MTRIASGVTDQGFYFVAVDSTDLKTRETGLTSFTVYRERNNGTAAAMTTPTVTEVDATNLPGVYFLLCDEDMTIDAGDEDQEMVYHITQASMAPVTKTITIYRPKITVGNTLDVTSGGEAGLDFNNINLPVGAIPALGIIDNGTAQAVGATSLQLRSAAAFPNSGIIGATILLTSGSDAGATALVTGYTGATDTATFSGWSSGVTPTGTPTYVVFGTAVGSSSGLDAAGVRAAVGLASANLDTQLGAIDTVVDAILVDTGTTLDARIPAALVGGRMDASVGAMAANVMTAAAAASDLTTELQSGLATASALSTVAGYLDTEVAAILAAVDTEVAAILALLDDARTEPGQGTPPVNPDVVTKIDYLYKAWRNRHTQTASQYSLYGDDGTTIHQKASFSDDTTTADRGEIVTGP